MSLGQNIKALRDHNGWTLEELSSRTNNLVDVGTIHALEKRRSTRSRYAPELAKAFGISLESLLSQEFTHRIDRFFDDADGRAEEASVLGYARIKKPVDQVDDATVLELFDEMIHVIEPSRRPAAAEILASWAREGGGEHWKKAFLALVSATKETDSPAAA